MLNTKHKVDRNGEGSRVREQRDTPSYAFKSSESSQIWKDNLQDQRVLIEQDFVISTNWNLENLESISRTVTVGTH